MRFGRHLAFCILCVFYFGACSSLENLANKFGGESNSSTPAQSQPQPQQEKPKSSGSFFGDLFGSKSKNQPELAPVDSESKPSAYSVIPFDSVQDRMGLKILEIRSFGMTFYDFAALTQNKKKKDLEVTLYKLGAVAGKINIGSSRVCFNSDCLGKWRAAKKFFGAVSYGDLFEDILLGRDIFNGLGKRIIEGGALVQYFTKSGEEFYYERRSGVILFENLTNGVKVSIQDYKK